MNFAALNQAFNSFTQGADASAAERDGTTYTANAIEDHGTVAAREAKKLRGAIFSVVGANFERAVLHDSFQAHFPVAPKGDCNIGYLIASTSRAAYGLAYFDGSCGCFDGYLTDSDNWFVLMVTPHGQYAKIKAHPCLDANGKFIRFADGPAHLIRVELPVGWPLPHLRVARTAKAGETVYAIARNMEHWVFSAGEVVDPGRNGSDILTSLGSYHGSCGAPAWLRNGALLGFGATIRFEGKDGHDVPLRGYGRSMYQSLSGLLARPSAKLPEDFQVEYI